ncbi:MAG: hypothetical protein C5B53_10830 [Candidatus Melainabacteria bacterium]|nr:MAG: hypothetical protein C5B53_10830 [Candidatus Melainabacteria bacterium]
MVPKTPHSTQFQGLQCSVRLENFESGLNRADNHIYVSTDNRSCLKARQEQAYGNAFLPPKNGVSIFGRVQAQ